MTQTILITGATDGIGLATARALAEKGHRLLLHGRNPAKLESVAAEIAALPGAGEVESHVADFSHLSEVASLASAILARRETLDVLINNAGILRTPQPRTADGAMDVRFVVNTLAPYLLTRRLLPVMGSGGRIVSLSSAAQASVNLDALQGKTNLSEMDAYAQSKLALTMWSRHLAQTYTENAPVFLAVNPGSLLATKMVQEGFGVSGGDIGKGANILMRAALSDEFAHASGQYFDNDSGRLASPHPDALDDAKCTEVVRVMDKILGETEEKY